MHVSAILGTRLQVVLRGVTHDFEFKVDLIDGDHIFTCIVLLDARQETLSEEET